MNPQVEYLLSRLKIKRNMIGVVAPQTKRYEHYCEFVEEVTEILEEWQNLREESDKTVDN